MGKKKKVAVDDEQEDELLSGDENEEDMKKKARAAKRAADAKALNDADIIQLGFLELAAKQQAEVEHEEEAPSQSFVVWIFHILTGKKKKPKPVWRTYRRKEVEKFLFMINKGPFKGHDSFWYRINTRRSLTYWGDRDPNKLKDGRGVCYWPDPPWGGGECYYGLWRADQPNAHGIFKWFDGDIYQGEWANGRMQGYGVYNYSALGPTPRDKFEGGYMDSHRQGTGVYSYAGKGGGIYMGEWLRGKMHGQGMIIYPDREYYIGNWKFDKKEGHGVYVWGNNAGDVAGDKFEGTFAGGCVQGLGKTQFSDGGWHKGRYMYGKMSGFGMMLTADGWMYIGSWKEDDLHGEVVCFFYYGAVESKKSVQTYDMGNIVSERAYDSHKDWTDLESLGRAEARQADEEAAKALEAVKRTAVLVKRAKVSQGLARDAADEARTLCRAAQEKEAYLKQWFGLKHRIFPDD